MKMWICRDLDAVLTIHEDKPSWIEHLECWHSKVSTELPTEYFPEVTFENSPREIELKLI